MGKKDHQKLTIVQHLNMARAKLLVEQASVKQFGLRVDDRPRLEEVLRISIGLVDECLLVLSASSDGPEQVQEELPF